MIDVEHAQSESVRGSPPPDDHWIPYSQQFKADPRRSDDPLLDRLSAEVSSHHTVIDVGAGAGRLALPLALRCRHVTAVEPSGSMAAVFLEQAEEYDIDNVTLVRSSWEQAEVDAADFVLCVHVIYTVREIERFLRKLGSHARERVLVVLFASPPQSQNYSLWKLIHGEERLPLPGLPQLEEVLRELGVDAQIEMLPPQPSRGFDTPEQAVQQLGQRLYLRPGSDEASLLEKTLPELLEEADGAYRIRGTQPLEPALVWWEPNRL